MYQMSPNGHLENETWVHSGCWLRKGLGKLHDVGKLYPKKGENLVFQCGTEFPVLQTHPFKAIWETARSLSHLLLELQLVPEPAISVVPLSPMLTM